MGLMGGSVKGQNTRMLVRMHIEKTVLMKFQIGKKTLWGIGLEAIFFTFWQRTCLYFVCVLRFCVRLNLKETD
jgi:hypothetical protein